MKKILVIYCGCENYSHLAGESKHAEARKLVDEAGVSKVVVGDLCGAVLYSEKLKGLVADVDKLVVVACYPRAVRELFGNAGIDLGSKELVVFNQRVDEVEKLKWLLEGSVDSVITEDVLIENQGDWVPWYPVIDKSRCINCGKCASFCLFGVYRVDADRRVEVIKPEGCKRDCPACSRICPEKAIVFAKLGESPCNGDEVGENTGPSADYEDMMRERMKANPMAFLKNRGGKGLEGLEEMKDKLGIPDSVFEKDK